MSDSSLLCIRCGHGHCGCGSVCMTNGCGCERCPGCGEHGTRRTFETTYAIHHDNRATTCKADSAYILAQRIFSLTSR